MPVVQIRFDLLTRGRARQATAFNPTGKCRTRAQIVSLELIDSGLFETYLLSSPSVLPTLWYFKHVLYMNHHYFLERLAILFILKNNDVLLSGQCNDVCQCLQVFLN